MNANDVDALAGNVAIGGSAEGGGAVVFHEENLRHLIAECGVGQIVYGTDYPFDWPVGVDFILNAAMLSNADKEAILGGTAAKLLRI